MHIWFVEVRVQLLLYCIPCQYNGILPVVCLTACMFSLSEFIIISKLYTMHALNFGKFLLRIVIYVHIIWFVHKHHARVRNVSEWTFFKGLVLIVMMIY